MTPVARRRIGASGPAMTLGEGEGRHPQLMTFAGKNWRGQDEEEFAQLIISFDQKMHNPPKGERHCREIARWYADGNKEPVNYGPAVRIGPAKHLTLEPSARVEGGAFDFMLGPWDGEKHGIFGTRRLHII